MNAFEVFKYTAQLPYLTAYLKHVFVSSLPNAASGAPCSVGAVEQVAT
jgi:hypothetical protein